MRQQLKSLTLTPEITFSDHFLTRFEFRHNWSNQPVFAVEEEVHDDRFKQNTASVGLILSF